jgi:hypothetical protein
MLCSNEGPMFSEMVSSSSYHDFGTMSAHLVCLCNILKGYSLVHFTTLRNELIYLFWSKILIFGY